MTDETFILADTIRAKLTKTIKATNVEPGSEVAIEIFLNQRLIEVIALAQTVMQDGKLSLSELITIVTFTVGAVRDGLSIYNDENQTDKTIVVREILQLVVGSLWRGDTALEKFLLSDGVLDNFIKLVYKLAVKR